MSHTRQEHTAISADDTRAWKQHMEEYNPKGLESFEKTRVVVKSKAMRLCSIAAKQLAAAYKHGDPFPSHFTWSGKGYVLEAPESLKLATKKQRKSNHFLEGLLVGIAADHEWDRLAALIVGLTTAGKIVTHWSTVEEDD